MQSTEDRPFEIRPMRSDEVSALVGWAMAEGLNPGLHDAACFAQIDPDGFFMGLLDEEPVGGIAAIRLSPEEGLIVWAIVREPYRGQGFDERLWQRAREHLGERGVSLEALATQEATVREAGFIPCARKVRYRAAPSGDTETGVRALASGDIDDLAGYDQRVTGGTRRALLECWLSQPDSHGVGLGAGEAMRGYGLRRRAAEGYLVGPVIADDPEAAGRIVAALLADVSEGPVWLDLPAAGPVTEQWVERFGLLAEFETLRMSSDPKRGDDSERTYVSAGLIIG